ncbi:hypothetical protein Taro_045901 [Colocasia esculenta]|uniref:Uncharacterized protein n=1 Tax=Colocasia esculenta TaxID=4460 RepID=A0A843X3F0_COLES|nr:hypothetical protein [Colocasia esculenta]
MKGECLENKKEKHKKIHKFKKPKAMVDTWSDEDSSEKEEEEKSSSSESEEICFMANSSDGKLEMENKDKQQKVEEIKTLENQLKEKDEVIETFTKGKDNLEALLGAKMNSISHGLGFNKQKPKKDKSGEKKGKAPLIKFVKGPSLENTEIKQTSSKTPKISKAQNQNKATRSTQSPDRSTPVHKKKDSVAVVSTPVKERSTRWSSSTFESGEHFTFFPPPTYPYPSSFIPFSPYSAIPLSLAPMTHKQAPRRGARSRATARPIPVDDAPPTKRRSKRRHDPAEQPGPSSASPSSTKRGRTSSGRGRGSANPRRRILVSSPDVSEESSSSSSSDATPSKSVNEGKIILKPRAVDLADTQLAAAFPEIHSFFSFQTWLPFISEFRVIYPHLVQEFYMNLECTDVGYKSEVKGVVIDMPTALAATLFKIPDEGADYHNFEFDLHEAYTMLTGLQADESDPKQTHVTKFNTNTFPPVLRLIHHILTTIITPQGGGRDRLTDIQRFVIYCMKKNIKAPVVPEDQPPAQEDQPPAHEDQPPVNEDQPHVENEVDVPLNAPISPQLQPSSSLNPDMEIPSFSPQPQVQASTSFGGPSIPPELYSFLNENFDALNTSIQQMTENFELKVQRLENTMSAKFIEQKAASDHAVQRFNRLIGTLADASIELKEHQEKLERVLQGILANSKADVFNTKEILSQISKTKLSFAHLVDDLESMKNLSAHIDEEMSDLKKEFKALHRHGGTAGTNIYCKGSVDTPHTGVDTMLQALSQKMKKWSTSVDTRPGQVDTRDRSQRNKSTDFYLRSTLDAVRSTLETSPRRPVLQYSPVCRHEMK